MKSPHPPQDTCNTILIVDDDPVSIRLLRAALRAYPDVRFAMSGGDALKLARERTPDIVLLDGEMPGQSGFEVCVALKSEDRLRDTPVIFVTAHSGLEFEMKALELGAADFIAKPISVPRVQLRVKLHLALKNKLDQQRHLAAIDGLTGLPNRRTLDEAITREYQRSLRSGLPLALMLIDVDHFKRFNDTYGHQAGDECLRQVAAVIGDAARRIADLPARFGGEEFALLLPDTTTEGARVVAEKLVAHVARAAIPHADSPVAPHVTVSIGVSSGHRHSGSPTHRPLIDSGEDLLRAADRALYRAKELGRNRAEQSPPVALAQTGTKG